MLKKIRDFELAHREVATEYLTYFRTPDIGLCQICFIAGREGYDYYWSAECEYCTQGAGIPNGIDCQYNLTYFFYWNTYENLIKLQRRRARYHILVADYIREIGRQFRKTDDFIVHMQEITKQIDKFVYLASLASENDNSGDRF